MKNITITEKYALCMLKEKKNLYERELVPHLIISMIVEMILDNNLEVVNRKKVKITNNLPVNQYNKQLYNIIKDMKKSEVSIKNIIKSICFSFSEKKKKAIIEPLKMQMSENEIISLQKKKMIFRNKKIITLNDASLSAIIEEVRAELLEDGSLTDDIILLASLLNSTKFLKNIFSKYEKEKIKDRLVEIKNTEIADKVKIAQDAINEMNAAIIAITVSSTT